MKTILTIFAFSSFIFVLVSCINSATAFTNRSICYQVVPENIGEHSAVNGSPTAADATVNAEKTTDTSNKVNAGQTVSDSSSNVQNVPSMPEIKKSESPADKADSK